MVAILPYVPSFGEKLASTFGGIATQLGEGYAKGRAETTLQRLLNGSNQQQVPGNISPEQMNQQQMAPQQPQSPSIDPFQLLQIENIATKARGKDAAKTLVQGIIESKKLQAKEATQSRKEETEAYKITQPYREKLLEGYEGYQKTNNQLNRLKSLNEQDKLTTPLLAKASETFGIPLSVIANPESEEFQKLSQDLLGNITKVFGNRILQVEVENFLKTIPTLLNSKEGRTRVIDNMQLLMEPQKLAYDAYKDIRKKGGKTPLDLHEKVLETIEPKLDKLAEKFKQSTDTFSSLPSAEQYKGRRFENAETGEILISDGKEWKPLGGK